MFAQVPLFPEQASTTAVDVDALFFFMCGVTGSLAALITVLVIYFAIKYRHRPGMPPPPQILGSTKLETFWTIVPLGIAIIMFAWGASVYFDMFRPPDDAEEIYVVGKQWMWKIQHKDGQREINELHVPVGRPIKLTMTSEDVIHDFFIPAFRMKHDVLPGRYVSYWFEATRTGTYHLFCAEYCGTGHSSMVGSVVVMEPEAYESWLNSHAEGSLALEGRKLFLQYQCVACHSANARARAPVLERIYGQPVPLQDGRAVRADETYLRESILRPRAKVVAGFEPIMPSYEGQINEEQMIRLIAFLKALGPGQTPPRVEESEPPAAAAERKQP